MSPAFPAKVLAKGGFPHGSFAKPKPLKCLMPIGLRRRTFAYLRISHSSGWFGCSALPHGTFGWPYAGFLFLSAAQAYECGLDGLGTPEARMNAKYVQLSTKGDGWLNAKKVESTKLALSQPI